MATKKPVVKNSTPKVSTPKKMVKIFDVHSVSYAGDPKGLLILVMCLMVVVVSVSSVFAINGSKSEDEALVNTLLSSNVLGASDGDVCRPTSKNLELKDMVGGDCYSGVRFSCSDGAVKTVSRSGGRCLSSSQWQKLADSYCSSRPSECK